MSIFTAKQAAAILIEAIDSLRGLAEDVALSEESDKSLDTIDTACSVIVKQLTHLRCALEQNGPNGPFDTKKLYWRDTHTEFVLKSAWKYLVRLGRPEETDEEWLKQKEILSFIKDQEASAKNILAEFVVDRGIKTK